MNLADQDFVRPPGEINYRKRDGRLFASRGLKPLATLVRTPGEGASTCCRRPLAK